MGWDKNGRYYTRSHKISGRVVREYIGGGVIGKMAEKKDLDERAQRANRVKDWKAQKEGMEAVEAVVAQLCDVTDLLARAAFLAAGYHQHKRGEWRRKRGQGNPDG